MAWGSSLDELLIVASSIVDPGFVVERAIRGGAENVFLRMAPRRPATRNSGPVRSITFTSSTVVQTDIPKEPLPLVVAPLPRGPNADGVHRGIGVGRVCRSPLRRRVATHALRPWTGRIRISDPNRLGLVLRRLEYSPFSPTSTHMTPSSSKPSEEMLCQRGEAGHPHLQDDNLSCHACCAKLSRTRVYRRS